MFVLRDTAGAPTPRQPINVVHAWSSWPRSPGNRAHPWLTLTGHVAKWLPRAAPIRADKLLASATATATGPHETCWACTDTPHWRCQDHTAGSHGFHSSHRSLRGGATALGVDEAEWGAHWPSGWWVSWPAPTAARRHRCGSWRIGKGAVHLLYRLTPFLFACAVRKTLHGGGALWQDHRGRYQS